MCGVVIVYGFTCFVCCVGVCDVDGSVVGVVVCCGAVRDVGGVVSGVVDTM